MTIEGRVLNFLGESMSAALASQYVLTFLSLKKMSLRSLGDVRVIQESILHDMMLRATSPSYPRASKTAYGLRLLDEDNRYIPAFGVFSRNMVSVGKDDNPMLLHLRDVGTDWENDGPELFRLLRDEMRTGSRFLMPAQLHPLCMQYACESPDILARLLVESKLQGWLTPMQMLRWIDINPNHVSFPQMMAQVVDRPFVARP